MRIIFTAIAILTTTIFTACVVPLPIIDKTEENVIKDLAYMKAVGTVYSDDADPEWEGAEVTLLWYDSKSELIFCYRYKDIALQVTIEIFARKSGVYPMRFTECVYKGEAELNYPFNIRIPFEHINANPQMHSSSGIANIVVHTPQQGDFSIEDISVPLYPYEKSE